MTSSLSTRPFVLLAAAALAASASAQAPPAAPAAPASPDTTVVTVEAVHAVVLPVKGSYLQHPEAFSRLGTFLAGKGITPSGPIFARYFSDPAVGEANLEWEVGLPVPAGVAVEPPFEVKDLPAALAAVRTYRGPMEGLEGAWPAFIEWVMTNGYQPLGPATHVFKGDLMSAPEVEMRMPIAK